MDDDGGDSASPGAESCALCTTPANLRCTGCLTTFYCSKEHQKQHWRHHKQACSAYKICNTPEYGRILVATRDLRPGELILQESPLVMSPSAMTKTLCLGCSSDNSKPLAHKCTCCGWLLCSARCESDPSSEHLPECSVFRRSKKPGSVEALAKTDNLEILLQIVAILRCVSLKFSHPARYATCLNLQSLPAKSAVTAAASDGGSAIGDSTRSMIVKTIMELFDLTGDDESAGTVKDDGALYSELLHVSGIFHINSHELPAGLRSPASSASQAVYKDASMAQHSCLNNASKHFDSGGRVALRAAVQIRKGDPIAINYSDPMWGTASRQAHLVQTKMFTCLCPRCRDPQELSTNFSSVVCKNCGPGGGGSSSASSPAASGSASGGHLSPVDPTDRSSAWRCSSCGSDESAEYVNAVIKSIGEELLRLERTDSLACLKFLKKHSQNLHQNHFFLMDVRLALVQMIGKGIGSIGGDKDKADSAKSEAEAEKELILKQKLCVELMDVVNVISPGISRLRAVVLYELQSALSQYARKKYLNGEITQSHLKNIYKEVRNNLSECIQIFSYEPGCLPEGQLAAIARLDLVEVDVFAETLSNKEENK